MRHTHQLCLLLILGRVLPCAEGARTREWPQWRGPKRDGVSTERALLSRWPADGPRLLWTAKGLGQGFTTVAVADGRIFTAGTIGDKTVITAIDLDGKIAWHIDNGPAYKGQHPGTRGCPTIHKGWLYHVSPVGHIVCLDPKTEMKIWSVNMLDKFGGRTVTWGLSESLLIEGQNVICQPGAEQAGVVALNRKSGKTVWVCKELGDKPGYASPIVFTFKGLRQIVTMTASAAVGIHARTGKLLWRFEHRTGHDADIPTPIFSDTGHVFIDSGYKTGGVLLKVLVKGNLSNVREVWTTKELDNHHGGVLLVNDHIFGSSSDGDWLCLNLRTGKSTYKERGIGKGSLTYADGKFYIMNEKGLVALVKASSKSHDIISRFNLPVKDPDYRKLPSWAHPVVCDGRLYLRYDDHLFCYDVKGR